jgi:hypothetical protein
LTRFLVLRVIRSLAVVLSLSGIVFALAHLVPGDPAAVIAGEQSTPELRAQIRAGLVAGYSAGRLDTRTDGRAGPRDVHPARCSTASRRGTSRCAPR